MAAHQKKPEFVKINDWHVIVHGLDDRVIEQWDISACTLKQARKEVLREHLEEWVDWELIPWDRQTASNLLLCSHGSTQHFHS